ncbi:hypothetical protein BKA93DRAFT_749693 [Sparassis latifolia]
MAVPHEHEDINGISLDSEPIFTDEELARFYPGVDENAHSTHQKLLRRECELLALRVQEEELDSVEEDANIIQEFQNLGLEGEEGDEDNMHEEFTGVPVDHDFAPYGNKTMFLLNVLDNLPKLRLSSSQLKMILWIMREVGS